MKIIVVDINGTPHEISQSVKPDFSILAKRLSRRFFVLASNESDLFDTANINHRIGQKDKERGGMFWQLRSCSKKCFSDYVTFLRSKNRTPYLLAQRRYRNDFR